ncbi:hypothetical protein [Streptomyces sp. NPDC058412]|uniref:hypothetical protein n=1 Tax=unclassified Streptomyces TaxID=2593676 RepID=UPI0036546CCA
MLKTADAVSPGVSTASVTLSLAVFTTLYAALAVVEIRLPVRPTSCPRPPTRTGA